jgi:hypothetical protein
MVAIGSGATRKPWPSGDGLPGSQVRPAAFHFATLPSKSRTLKPMWLTDEPSVPPLDSCLRSST